MTQTSIPAFSLRVDGRTVLPLAAGMPSLTIGREAGCAVVLTDDRVSRRHAEVRFTSERPVILDLGSSNGTTVNGQALTPHVERAVNEGDVIAIGPHRLTLTREPGGPWPPLEVGPRQESSRRSWVQRFLMGMAALMSVLLAGLAAAVALVWFFSPPNVSVLLLGSDARPSELAAGDRGRTDTMVAYVADRATGRTLMIPIPRDLWVPISSGSPGKINTAYRVGGAEHARQVVASAIGVPMDRHLTIGLQGVREIVDALGGIDVTVDAPIRDERYPTDDFRTTVFELGAGRQHLDGETALRYARTRSADDDLARIGRQQRVIQGIREAMSSPANAWRLPGTLAAIQRSAQTDLTLADGLTLLVANLRSGGATDRYVPAWDAFAPFMAPGGEAALQPRPEFRSGIATLLIGQGARIEVLNASGRSGVAAQAAATLTARGLHVARVDTAERPERTTTVQVRPEHRLAGHAMSTLLGIPSAVVRESRDLPVDIRLTLGAGS